MSFNTESKDPSPTFNAPPFCMNKEVKALKWVFLWNEGSICLGETMLFYIIFIALLELLSVEFLIL
jgi:hypothetical protein